MLHLSSLSWIQIFLVEVGLVLLIIALRDVLAGRTAYHGHPHSRHENTADHEQDHESERQETAQAPDEADAENSRKEIRAAKLTKTSNVKFVQTFKFREQQHPHRHLPHH